MQGGIGRSPAVTWSKTMAGSSLRGGREPSSRPTRHLEGRTPEEISLPVLDAEREKRVFFLGPLDPFGDDHRVDASPDRGEARDDLALDRVVLETAHQRVGDLDVVRLQLKDRLEPGVSRPRIVDRDLEPRAADRREDPAERRVIDHLLLRDLDDDVAMAAVDAGEVPFVQKDRIAEEARRSVHEEAPRGDRPRQRGEDRLEAQRLELDVQAVLARDREEDVRRLEGRPLRPADEGFPADDDVVGEVAKGLEGGAQLLLSEHA